MPYLLMDDYKKQFLGGFAALETAFVSGFWLDLEPDRLF
jgi:hypothetical protein